MTTLGKAVTEICVAHERLLAQLFPCKDEA